MPCKPCSISASLYCCACYYMLLLRSRMQCKSLRTFTDRYCADEMRVSAAQTIRKEGNLHSLYIILWSQEEELKRNPTVFLQSLVNYFGADMNENRRELQMTGRFFFLLLLLPLTLWLLFISTIPLLQFLTI